MDRKYTGKTHRALTLGGKTYCGHFRDHLSLFFQEETVRIQSLIYLYNRDCLILSGGLSTKTSSSSSNSIIA